jgi:hypothetical protein
MILALLLSACGGQTTEQAAEPTEAPAATEDEDTAATEDEDTAATEDEDTAATEDEDTAATEDEDTAATEDEDTAATEDEDTAATEDEDLPTGPVNLDISAGVDELDSYRAVFTMDIEGVDAEGTDQSGTIDMTVEVDNTTENAHIVMDMSGGAAGESENVSMEMYQVDSEAYMLMAGVGCISTPTGAEELPAVGDMIGDSTIEGAVLTERGVEVNGIMTDRYTIEDVGALMSDEEMDIEDMTVRSADVWIAQDGGYLVRMDIDATATDAQGSEGDFTMQYELQEVNTVGEITLPDECANASEIPGIDSLPAVPETP